VLRGAQRKIQKSYRRLVAIRVRAVDLPPLNALSIGPLEAQKIGDLML
jgi:hypothetical protein